MALINCYECNKEISDQAKSCPNCGALKSNKPVTEKQKTKNEAITIMVVLVGVITLFSCLAKNTPDNNATHTYQDENAYKPTHQDLSEGEPLSIPSDAKAKYFILERGEIDGQPTLTTKRVGSSGVSYSKRIFNCQTNEGKYLGNGDTLEEMESSLGDKYMYKLVPNSIAWVVFQKACK